MKKKVSIIIIIAIILSGAMSSVFILNKPKYKAPSMPSMPSHNFNAPNTPGMAEFEVSMRFLSWYRDNYDRLNSFVIVDMSNQNLTPPGPAFINLDECEKYLQAMKDSGYLSDRYITKLRNIYIKEEKLIREENVTEGFPSGELSSDLLFRTHDLDCVLESICMPEIVYYDSKNEYRSEIWIDLQCVNTYIHLVKEDQLWVIEDFSF